MTKYPNGLAAKQASASAGAARPSDEVDSAQRGARMDGAHSVDA